MTGSLAVPLMVLLGAASGYSNEAHLILRKEISSDECKVSGADLQCVVEGGDTMLSYSLYNVGTSAAYDVQVADDTLDEAFTLAKPVGFTFDSIAAGENVTAHMTVVPKSSGAVEVGAASVSYNAVADGEKKMVGFSTEAPAFHSETAREHKRRVDYHYKEWFLFALVATVGPVGWPLWNHMKTPLP